jgi:phage-related minor tail protein
MIPKAVHAALPIALLAQGAGATPTDLSCRFLDVLGGNKAGEVEALMADLAQAWPEGNRTEATQRLQALLGDVAFAGGSVYRMAQLGQDLEEHLVLLRLSEGELVGARLLYEWAPEGMRLTSLDFNDDYADMTATQVLQPPEPLGCP